MKVIHLSTSDWNGGAAIAAKRIVESQQHLSELQANLFVQSQKSKDKFIYSAKESAFSKAYRIYNRYADELLIRLLTVQSRSRFTFPYLGEDISQIELISNADILNLHWINGGFLSLDSLRKLSKLNKPIFWTLHDMWAFTGGCHYASDCNRFADHCCNCPSLFFKSDRDISYKIFNDKLELFNRLNLNIITCSNWLTQEATKSKLLKDKKVFAIPNPIQTEIFKPTNKKKAREKLKLPIDRKIILIGAMNLKDERKGFRYLIEALNILKKLKFDKEIELVFFGKLDNDSLQKIPFETNQLGMLKTEDEIVMAYNSADVYVAPSLQDNLPNTVMESLSCGVPVVAFNVGGIPDMVDHMQNGILAELKSSKDLAEGIHLLLSDDSLYEKFSNAAREKVLKNFDQQIVAKKYFELYQTVL